MEPGLIYWHISWCQLQELDQDLKLSLATERESEACREAARGESSSYKFGNMNFPQHPDKGRSGRVRSIWRSITGANSGLAQHNYGPRVFRNAPRFYLGVRFKRKHVPSLNSAF